MSTLGINITVESLSVLTSVGLNTYEVDLEFLDSDGDPLGNPNIPNTYTGTVVTTLLTFTVEIPVTTGTYTIPNVTVKAYGADSCCFAKKVITIVNDGGVVPPPNELEITGYFVA